MTFSTQPALSRLVQGCLKIYQGRTPDHILTTVLREMLSIIEIHLATIYPPDSHPSIRLKLPVIFESALDTELVTMD